MQASSFRLAIVALMMAGTAQAQVPSLVGGVWVHSDRFEDPMRPGNPMLVSTLATFRPDGKLIVQRQQSATGFGAVSTAEYDYQMTGPSTYFTILTDWGPKQDCSNGIACVQYPNPFGPIGTRGQCTFAFESPLAINLGCGEGGTVHWTRH